MDGCWAVVTLWNLGEIAFRRRSKHGGGLEGLAAVLQPRRIRSPQLSLFIYSLIYHHRISLLILILIYVYLIISLSIYYFFVMI